jgi:hypothetical protein
VRQIRSAEGIRIDVCWKSRLASRRCCGCDRQSTSDAVTGQNYLLPRRVAFRQLGRAANERRLQRSARATALLAGQSKDPRRAIAPSHTCPGQQVGANTSKCDPTRPQRRSGALMRHEALASGLEAGCAELLPLSPGLISPRLIMCWQHFAEL